MFKPVAVIPVFNHGAPLPAMVRGVLQAGLPCILVDDGSDEECAAVVRELSTNAQVTALRLGSNQGKGAAMVAGLKAAAAAGYTHALQIDADGQHKTDDIERFIVLARANPQAVVCGYPVYDESVPKSRLYARYATHVWVWINTLSFSIRDSMCGFRVYPLGPTMRLVSSRDVGRRMDFDTDIIVRLYWQGADIVNTPTRVTYPADGISHFRIWRDNLLITRMHTVLFFGMLLRLPVLLLRNLSRATKAHRVLP